MPRSSSRVVAVLAGVLALAPRIARAQWRTGWEMNNGEGIVRFPVPVTSHGIPSEYVFATIPGAMDTRWRPAPNGDSLEYSIRSTICDTGIDCGGGADFTYFRTFVCAPAAGSIRALTLGITEVDDGTRITIVNSRFPSGTVPPNAFAALFGGMYQSADLAPFLVPGERNTLLLTHVDDCCQDSFVRGVTLLTDTGSLSIGEVAETCNGLDDDCNGRVDDGLGQVTCGVGNCERTIEHCQGGMFVTCVPGEPRTEICDSFDNDCDGAIDEGLGMTSCGVGRCMNVVPNCAHGFPVQCVPGPPRDELCNGLDDDCDGEIDDGCVEAGPEPMPEAGVDVVDAIDAVVPERPRILLEGRAGPLGCACGAARGARGEGSYVLAFGALAGIALRRRRPSRRVRPPVNSRATFELPTFVGGVVGRCGACNASVVWGARAGPATTTAMDRGETARGLSSRGEREANRSHVG